jgi:hypothetical protein
MPKTLSVSYGEADAPFKVEVFVLDPAESSRGIYTETLGFESRESLAIFFANGATLGPDRYYRVTGVGS